MRTECWFTDGRSCVEYNYTYRECPRYAPCIKYIYLPSPEHRGHGVGVFIDLFWLGCTLPPTSKHSPQDFNIPRAFAVLIYFVFLCFFVKKSFPMMEMKKIRKMIIMFCIKVLTLAGTEKVDNSNFS